MDESTDKNVATLSVYIRFISNNFLEELLSLLLQKIHYIKAVGVPIPNFGLCVLYNLLNT